MKDQALKGLEFRFRFFSILIFGVFALLLLRLWYLQIIRGNDTLAQSRMNQSRFIMIPAERGVFYDRKGKVLAFSRISHVVSVVPNDVNKNPSVINFLSKVLKINKDDLLALIEEKGKKDPKAFVPIVSDVDSKAVGQILEAKLDLPGVEIDAYPVRFYPKGEWASHLFGYIGEISPKELEQMRADNYRMGDIVGKTGLEKAYETYLRGKEGAKIVEVDRRGHALRVMEERASYPGNNLQLTIDMELQETAETALREHLQWLRENSNYKRARSGAVIAIDPRTGDVLAMVSYPGYDPNLFVGSNRGSIAAMLVDPLHPFTNRAIQGTFMPGSTFKPITVMAALEEKKANENSHFGCTGHDRIHGSKFKCWNVRRQPGGHGRQNLVESLQNSCNMVMADLARLVGPENLAKYSRLFGLGKRTGINLPPGDSAGLVGDPQWKARRFPKEPRWYPLESLHYSIGQGYITVTPLQLAMAYAGLANEGKFYTPRVVSSISSPEGKVIRRFPPKLDHMARFDSKNIDLVNEGLVRVISQGTARSFFTGFPLDKYPVAGKTGTAQNKGKDDFALFASFAPANDPEIVVVVVVEEGGSGGLAGAPIARRLYETHFGIERPQKTEPPRRPAASPAPAPAQTQAATTAPAPNSPSTNTTPSPASPAAPNSTTPPADNPPAVNPQ